jgi:lysozyme family protein
MNNENFDTAYEKLKESEGGYTDGKNQANDEPTNMGVKQSTLDRYNKQNPGINFPGDVKNLKPEQAKEIYKNNYWDKTNIPKIENDRIRDAVFDMNVMGGAGISVQKALNLYAGAKLKVDGVIGSKTTNALNAIPRNEISGFMDTLKTERLNYLKQTPNWATAQNGWTKRTFAY